MKFNSISDLPDKTPDKTLDELSEVNPHPQADASEARDRLLLVAGRLFAAKGMDGVSTRELAKASDVNLSLISYYFGGKEGLYLAVLNDFASQAKVRLGAVLGELHEDSLTKQGFLDCMKKMLSGMVAMKVTHPHMTELMHREALSGLPYAREIYDTTFRAMADRIVGILILAQKKHILNPSIHPYLLFISMVHAQDMYFAANKCSAGIMEKCFRLPEQMDAYTEELFKIFIEGHTL